MSDQPNAPSGKPESENASEECGGEGVSAKKKKRAKKKTSFIGRIFKLFFESLAVLLGISLLAILILGWFISRGPVNADFLLPYIEKALNDVQGQMSVQIGALQLEWHGWQSPLGLKAIDLELSNNKGPFLDIKQAELDVSLTNILQSKVQFKQAVIRGVQAKIVKQADGKIRLFKEEQKTYGPQPGTTPLTIEKVIANLPPINTLRIQDAHIEYLDIAKDVKQELSDVELSIVQNYPDNVQVKDVSGYVKFSLGAQKEINNLSMDFIYNPEDKNLSITGSLGDTDVYSLAEFFEVQNIFDEQNIVPKVPLQARTSAILGNDWRIELFELRTQTQEGHFEIPQVPKGRLDIGSMNVTLSYNPDLRKLALYETQLAIEGMDVSLSADLSLPSPENNDMFSGNLALNLASINIDELENLVPQSLDHEPLYEWMVEKISTGRFSDVNVTADIFGEKVKEQASAQNANNSYSMGYEALEIDYEIVIIEGETMALPPRKPDWTTLFQEEINAEFIYDVEDIYTVVQPEEGFVWEWDAANVLVDFAYEDLKIEYKKPMAPAEKVKGIGRVEGKSLKLDVQSAELGGMKVKTGELFFDDLVTKGKGNALIELKMETSLLDAFSFLQKDPINFGQNLDLEMNAAKGSADLDVKITFPTVKDLLVEDINVDVNGTIYNAVLPKVLRGMSLTGGPYKIHATQNEYSMKGEGKLDGRDIKIDWHSYFARGKGRPYESRIQASFVADKSFRERIGADLSDFVEGSIPVSVDVRENWDKSTHIALTGLVNRAKLMIEPFEFETSGENVGNVKADIYLSNGKLSSVKNLNVNTRQLAVVDGDIEFAHDSLVSDLRVSNATFKQLSFAQNDFSLQLEETRDGMIKAALGGDQVDARIFLAPEEDGRANESREALSTEKNEGFEVGLDVKRVLTVENESIANVDAYIKGQTGKISQLELDCVAGKGSIYLRYKPNMEDRYSLRIEATDAGAMLRALGVTDKVSGGRITVAGLPLNTGYYGDVRGLARIDDFSVSAAPAFAGLIKLMDLPTVLTSLNKEGLSFARLETEFEWRNRRGGGVISFKEGRTSGGSVGLTFAGDINRTANLVAITGTIVPASTLNSFFSGIPLVGDILSGGSGSIFAATYSVKGDTENPDTDVNPLSVLAPGLLRRLLFEGGD